MRKIIGARKPNDRYDVRSRDCHAMDAHMSQGKLSNGASGGASNLLAQEDLSSFEEAHHWNIQAKFYSVKGRHIAICMYDDLYGVQGIEDEVLVWISQKEQQCAPSIFFVFSFFYFFYFFGGLNGSFYLTLICPLWDLLILSSLGSFSHFRGNTLYFTIIQEIFHTLQRYSHKEDITIMMQMYAFARIAGYAMILVRHVAMIRARPNQHAAH